ncbi:MAG: tetratricopeptide repeat protein [Rhodospirillaceae bacterium]|nr:tetratricopeptide repeat protein [Rhodospirillaceae bacterium]
MTGVSPTFRAAFEAHQAGRIPEAERGYRAVLKAEPRNADAWHLLGLIAQHHNDLPKAVDHITKALTLSGPNADFLTNLGVVYEAMGHSAEAAETLQQATVLSPHDFTALFALGNALKSLGRPEEALAYYQRAATQQPGNASVLNNMGSALQSLGRLTEAAQCFRQVLAIRPDHAGAHYNLGVLLKDAGKLPEAADYFRHALRLAPDLAEAHVNLGAYLHDLGDLDQAMAHARKAIALHPKDPAAYNNLGAALRDAGRFEEAMECYANSIKLRPDMTEVWHNQGVALEQAGRHDEALERFQNAGKANPLFIDAQVNAALLMLMGGDFKAGWDAYEVRWRRDIPGLGLRQFPLPAWQGERESAGIVVWGEQGIGDRVLYASMIPDLLAQGHRVVMETEPRLHALFARSFPGVTMVAKENPPHPATAASDIRWHSPLASLGRYLRTDVSAFPKREAYLAADPKRTAAYTAYLRKNAGSGLVIGISWVSRAPKIGLHKSLALRQWGPILKTQGARFVDLQYGDTTKERSAVEAEFGVPIIHIPELDLREDIDGVASLIAACDLVISVSNTTVHLAAALGKPTWIMVPAAAGNLWYWMRGTGHTPWYPSATIFRQKTLGRWDDVLQEVKEKLVAHLADTPPLQQIN